MSTENNNTNTDIITTTTIPWVSFVILILNTFMSFVAMIYPPIAHFIGKIKRCKFCGSEVSISQTTPPGTQTSSPIPPIITDLPMHPNP